MSDRVRYWSPEFIEVYVGLLRTDAGFQKSARKFDGVIQLRCTDTPGGKDITATYTIKKGQVDVSVDVQDAPGAMRHEKYDKRRCLARTTAPYHLWCKLDRGEMSVVGAITSPEYNLEGSKLKVMTNIGLFNAMSAVSAKMDKDF